MTSNIISFKTCSSRLLIGAMLLLGSVTAQSTSSTAAQEDSQTTEHVVNHVTLAPDASYDRDDENTIVIRDQNDLQNRTTRVKSFIAGLQQLTVSDAYILRPDGTKIQVGQEHVFTKDAPGSQGYADFGDNKVVQVLFPGVSIGDRLYVHWHLHSAALFPGRYSLLDEADVLGHPYTSEITVNAPKSLHLQASARGLVHLTQKDLGDRSEFTLTDSLATSVPEEPAEECPCDFAGAGSVSNFASWSDVARAYRDRAADKSAVTPDIQQLSDQVVGQKKGLNAVRAVDDWVRQNVRYVQVYLDAGGYVPHAASSVLKNRYGDCKDYVTLSQALLKAAGIDSEPVLVGTMARYQEIPLPGPEQFNHAVLYVPSLKLYLNPTDRFGPLGAYWDALYGKPILRTTQGDLTRFESSSAAANSYAQTSEYTLDNDGTLIGSMSAKATGSFDSSIRNSFASLTPERAPQVLRDTLAHYGEPGNGTLTVAAPFAPDGTELISATWLSKDAFTPDDIVSLKVPMGFSYISFDAFKQFVALEQRVTPVAQQLASFHKVVTLHLPAGYSVLKLPKDAQNDTPAFSYQVTYRQQGTDILADQLLEFKQNVIQPEQYGAYRTDLLNALRAVDAPILLQKK